MIKKKKLIIYYIYFVYIILLAGVASFANNDTFFAIIFLITSGIFLLKGKKIDLVFSLFILFWIIVNIFSYIVNDLSSFSLLSFLGVSMKIILPYLMIKIIGEDFFLYFQKTIISLTLISFVFFIIDFSFPFIFESVSSYLDFMVITEQKEHGGWYLFFYMHNGWAFLPGYDFIYRNSGFMWEPGGFALILIFSLIFHFGKNNFRFDKIALLLIISILTTFSTSGYIALFIVLIAATLYYNMAKVNLIVLLFPMLIYGGYFLYQLDFISGKIETNQEQIDYTGLHHSGVTRVNRLAIFNYSIEQAKVWPLGNGIFDSKFLIDKYKVIYSGSNTIAYFIMVWGISGALFFIFLIFSFFKWEFGLNHFITSLLTLSFLIVLFSNNVQSLVYTIVFYYLTFGRYRYVFSSSGSNYNLISKSID